MLEATNISTIRNYIVTEDARVGACNRGTLDIRRAMGAFSQMRRVLKYCAGLQGNRTAKERREKS